MSSSASRLHLPPELQGWVAEQLARQAPEEAVMQQLSRAGVSLEQMRGELSSMRSHPAVVAGGRLARRLARLESVLELYQGLYCQAGAPGVLERRSGVGAEEFFARYYYPHRPVILCDLMKDWPALERWRPERLAERFGEQLVEIMTGRETDAEHENEPDRHRTVLPLREFVRMLGRQVTNDYYLVGHNFVLDRPEFHSLLEDFSLPEGYLAQAPRPGATKLWMGPAGTLTALHHDLSCVLFAQVHGRKRFKLIPSFELSLVYNSRGAFSDVDAEAPDDERFPAYRRTHVLETVLEPGEMLFIPVGWWHWVKALDISVSVTFQDFAIPDRNTEWRPG